MEQMRELKCEACGGSGYDDEWGFSFPCSCCDGKGTAKQSLTIESIMAVGPIGCCNIVEKDAAEILSLMQPEIDRRVAEEKAKLLERLRGWKAQYRGDADEGTIPLAAEAADALTTLSARVETLEAANSRLQEAQAMHGGRYWEARYRDEAADNAKLREIISRAIDAYWGMRQTELSASEVGGELADKIANTGYGLHLKIAMKDAQALAGDDHG